MCERFGHRSLGFWSGHDMSRTLRVFHFEPSSGNFTLEYVTSSKPLKQSGSMVAYGATMYDSILFVAICRAHRKMLLRELSSRKGSGLYYLPFFPLKLSKFVKCFWLNSYFLLITITFRRFLERPNSASCSTHSYKCRLPDKWSVCRHPHSIVTSTQPNPFAKVLWLSSPAGGEPWTGQMYWYVQFGP